VYAGLRLAPGDEVVTTEHDFYATHEALRLRAERDGIAVRRVRLYDDPAAVSPGAIADAVAAALTRETRVLAVTWVHSSTGVKLPLADVAEVVAAANRARPDGERILLCVDGIHGLGVEAASPVELGADVLVSGCHKWLFGPRGTGIVWAAPHAWERIAPTIPSFDGQAYVAWMEGRPPTDAAPGPLMTPGGYHSFEHRWALAEAFALHDELGRDEVEARTHGLATRLKEGLAALPGVSVVTPLAPELSGGLVCCELDAATPGEAVDRLREEHGVLASVTPYATAYLRFGPSIANDEADVDAALEAVRALTA
jgi:selenocysteine lyase/cysteine desulfurase